MLHISLIYMSRSYFINNNRCPGLQQFLFDFLRFQTVGALNKYLCFTCVSQSETCSEDYNKLLQSNFRLHFQQINAILPLWIIRFKWGYSSFNFFYVYIFLCRNQIPLWTPVWGFQFYISPEILRQIYCYWSGSVSFIVSPLVFINSSMLVFILITYTWGSFESIL